MATIIKKNFEFEKEGKTVKGAYFCVRVETPLGSVDYKILTKSNTDKILLNSIAETEENE